MQQKNHVVLPKIITPSKTEKRDLEVDINFEQAERYPDIPYNKKNKHVKDTNLLVIPDN